MKFLILDVENANKYINEGKICLLGYKVFDDDLNELEKKEILINPMADFDDYVLQNLPHDKVDFDETKSFKDLYEDLKNILEQEEQVVISRNGYNDIKLIKNECDSKGLVPFTFKFYDFNEILVAYNKFNNENKLTIELNRDAIKNVENIFETLKAICGNMQKSIREILVLAVNSEGVFQDGYISFRRTKDVINPENTFNSNLNKNSNYKVFLRLLENLTLPEGETVLKDKKVCLSTNYETENFKEMVKLAIWLNENGAKYVLDAKQADIFVKFDVKNQNGKLKRCARLNMVEEAKNEGQVIDVITLEELLSKLNKTMEELLSDEMPSLDFIYGENSKNIKLPKKYKKIRKNFGKI